jgi:FdhD protein
LTAGRGGLVAVDLASQPGLTLAAFLRGDSMNIYARADRVVS